MKYSVFALLALLAMYSSDLDAQRNTGNKITASKVAETQKSKQIEMFLEDECKLGFDETVEKLMTNVESRSWKVLATHDLQQTMKKHGNDVLPVTVLALCHPKHSAKILKLDDERIISPMMPCRVSIYNKSDGKTYISRMNSIAMAQNFDGVIKEVMTDSALEVEEMIRELIIEK